MFLFSFKVRRSNFRVMSNGMVKGPYGWTFPARDISLANGFGTELVEAFELAKKIHEGLVFHSH